MLAEELRGKSNEELKGLLVDMKKEAMNLRFQKSTGELENTSRINVVRRSIARINTFLAQPEKERIANAPAPKKTTKKKDTKKADAKKEEKKAAPKKKAAAKKETTEKKETKKKATKKADKE